MVWVSATPWMLSRRDCPKVCTIKNIQYTVCCMSQMALGNLNWRPDGSSSNSECSGWRCLQLLCWPSLTFLCTALSNILQSCFCDLPITFPAMPTILESLFLLFTFIRYTNMLNDKMLSTRLLYAILNMCWITPKLLSFLRFKNFQMWSDDMRTCLFWAHNSLEAHSLNPWITWTFSLWKENLSWLTSANRAGDVYVGDLPLVQP